MANLPCDFSMISLPLQCDHCYFTTVIFNSAISLSLLDIDIIIKFVRQQYHYQIAISLLDVLDNNIIIKSRYQYQISIDINIRYQY